MHTERQRLHLTLATSSSGRKPSNLPSWSKHASTIARVLGCRLASSSSNETAASPSVSKAAKT